MVLKGLEFTTLLDTFWVFLIFFPNVKRGKIYRLLEILAWAAYA
jgi:hypothetical protein